MHSEDLLPVDYQDGPPVHAIGALSKSGKNCPTAIFSAEIEGKKTIMTAAVVPRQELPYPAIVGRNSGVSPIFPGFMTGGVVAMLGRETS